jgi:hypothetical protein
VAALQKRRRQQQRTKAILTGAALVAASLLVVAILPTFSHSPESYAYVYIDIDDERVPLDAAPDLGTEDTATEADSEPKDVPKAWGTGKRKPPTGMEGPK